MCDIRRTIGKNEVSVEGHTRKTKEAKDRCATIGSDGSREIVVRQTPSSIVDRMEPTVREHMADVADREATVVHVERMGLLEVEDEVKRSRRGCNETWLIPITENLTSFPFWAHTDGCAVWWGRMS